ISAPGHRPDERRRRGIVAQRLAEIGNRLRHRVFRDFGARPDAVANLFLGDEDPGPIEKIEQQVEKLWREFDRNAVAGRAVGLPVGLKRAEPERHVRILGYMAEYSRPGCRCPYRDGMSRVASLGMMSTNSKIAAKANRRPPGDASGSRMGCGPN